jgi:hypothetical protein
MSRSIFRILLVVALLGTVLMAAVPAGADDVANLDPNAQVSGAGWRVDGLTGAAETRRGSAPFAPLAVGQVLLVGSDIRTGAGAVVFLSHDGDRLVIQPDTQLRIAEPQSGGLLDRFIQTLGNVFYDVEPRRNRSFGVNAPYVAAIVKGTKFLVSVDPKINSVRVDEGRVLVESADGAPAVMVGAGRIAKAEPAHARGLQLSSSGIPAESSTSPVASPEQLGAVDGAQPVGDAASAQADTAPLVDATSDAIGESADAIEDTTSAVGGVRDAVGGAVSGVGQAAGGAVGGAVDDTAGGLGGGLRGAVGGVIGGLDGVLGGE